MVRIVYYVSTEPLIALTACSGRIAGTECVAIYVVRLQALLYESGAYSLSRSRYFWPPHTSARRCIRTEYFGIVSDPVGLTVNFTVILPLVLDRLLREWDDGSVGFVGVLMVSPDENKLRQNMPSSPRTQPITEMDEKRNFLFDLRLLKPREV